MVIQTVRDIYRISIMDSFEPTVGCRLIAVGAKSIGAEAASVPSTFRFDEHVVAAAVWGNLLRQVSVYQANCS